MNAKKFSINIIMIAIGASAIITAFIFLAVIWSMTGSVQFVFCGVTFALLLFLWAVLFVAIIRRKIARFTSDICQTLDDMMSGNISPQYANEEESLFVKINSRLKRLYDVMLESRNHATQERSRLQELISDISHQVKTPIANLKMTNDLMLEQDIPKEKRQEFLKATSGQIDKLDFLIQAMIKTSRLEAGIITLAKNDCPIYETLAAALGGILLSAEKKHIKININCPNDLTVPHDIKWTGEALFNILDNAVKYTTEGGSIDVSVAQWEFYTKIDIADSGKGISESRHAEIFKRFYREEEVHNTEGIGIGLYLAREIISLQSGYIKVASEVDKGSTFSIFLPNKE